MGLNNVNYYEYIIQNMHHAGTKNERWNSSHESWNSPYQIQARNSV